MNNCLRLNKKIYSENILEKGRLGFSDVCDISIADESEYFCCFFYNLKTDFEIVKNEFENYLIGLVRQNEY